MKTRQIALPAWMILVVAILGGCMSERHMQIPADAMMASEGDKELQFHATQSGMAYVYDRNNDRMVYSGQMNAGQTLMVDPEHDRITIDGRTVMEKGLNKMDTRRIFFKPRGTTERVIIEEHHDTR